MLVAKSKIFAVLSSAQETNLTEELLKEMSLMLDLLWAWKWFF
jgi:hypothetical protein